MGGQVPEIKETGTDANPGVRLELSGVDVDSVIANAQVNDNPGNRVALARRLLSEELGVEHGQLSDQLGFVWRGTARTAEVVFGNVADEDELPDHDLMPQEEGRWRIAIDLPFDEGEWGPVEDVNRMRRLRERQQGERSLTVAWLPAHLSAQRLADFRRLVVIDKALADEHRFDTQYAGHLNADNRSRAKGLLETQREALLKQVRGAFKQAYGLAQKQAADVVPDFDDHLVALPDVDGLTLSFGQSLHDGIRHIAGRLLTHQYPAHPDLDPDATGTAVKAADTKKVFTHVRAAAEARDGRVEVPAADRKLMQRIAGPLRLGQQKEAYFELSRYWADHFRQLASAQGVTGDLSLITLTDWTDLPDPRGLPDFLARLVVAAFAEMDDRVWVRGGTVLDPAPELAAIKDHDALRSQPLPAETDWDTARQRFETSGRSRPRCGAAAWSTSSPARSSRPPAPTGTTPPTWCTNWRRTPPSSASTRPPTPDASPWPAAPCNSSTRSPRRPGRARRKTVEALASFDLGATSADRYGTSVKQAHGVAAAVASAPWTTLELAAGLGPEGAALLDSLRNVARDDQRTADLRDALARTQREVVALLKRSQAATRRRPRPRPGRSPTTCP